MYAWLHGRDCINPSVIEIDEKPPLRRTQTHDPRIPNRLYTKHQHATWNCRVYAQSSTSQHAQWHMGGCQSRPNWYTRCQKMEKDWIHHRSASAWVWQNRCIWARRDASVCIKQPRPVCKADFGANSSSRRKAMSICKGKHWSDRLTMQSLEHHVH